MFKKFNLLDILFKPGSNVTNNNNNNVNII